MAAEIIQLPGAMSESRVQRYRGRYPGNVVPAWKVNCRRRAKSAQGHPAAEPGDAGPMPPRVQRFGRSALQELNEWCAAGGAVLLVLALQDDSGECKSVRFRAADNALDLSRIALGLAMNLVPNSGKP